MKRHGEGGRGVGGKKRVGSIRLRVKLISEKENIPEPIRWNINGVECAEASISAGYR